MTSRLGLSLIGAVVVLGASAACGGAPLPGPLPPTAAPTAAPTQAPACCSYPYPSIGGDNQFHAGGSFSAWSAAGAYDSFVITAGDLVVNSRNPNGAPATNINQQISDALPAIASGHIVYTYFCAEPSSGDHPTVGSINNVVDGLSGAGLFGDLNAYGGAFFIIFDIEDGDACGPWNNGIDSLATEEADLTEYAQLIVNRATADGLNPTTTMAVASDPYVAAADGNTKTAQIAAWVANSFSLSDVARDGVAFPQLLGYHVQMSSWLNNDNTMMSFYINDGIRATLLYPNYEDFHSDGTTTCDTQADINLMLEVGAGAPRVWYPWHTPWCVSAGG